MEGLSHYQQSDRPWGNFERFTLNETTTVKIVSVSEGGILSLQTHARRKEFWHIISGVGTTIIGEEKRQVKPGDNLFVPQGETHRFMGGPGGCVFLEIAFGEFDEADITRIEDVYGRT